MSASGGGGGGGGGGGALSLMGCVREASPPPQEPANQLEFSVQPSLDAQPKEPKKRRFHPLRGLRKIFRRKSRGAADLNATSCSNAEGNDRVLSSRDREEVTLRHPAGRPEESRSRSASELLTDPCNRESTTAESNDYYWPRKYRAAVVSLNRYELSETVFLRRSGVGEAFAKLRGGPGQLSVSHDSVFPGEVPHTRPLSSVDPLATLERRPSKVSETESKETSSLVTQKHRISLQVLEQIKTVIESRNQVSSSDSTILQNRSSSSNVYHVEQTQTKATTTKSSTEYVTQTIRSQTKEDLPELESVPLNHTAAMHRINVRPKNRRLPRRVSSQKIGPSLNITTISEGSDTLDSLETLGSVADSPIESRNVTVIRKSSSRLSKTTDIFGELETKLSSPGSALSKSPDSLENNGIILSLPVEEGGGQIVEMIKPVTRKLSNRISKGSDIFAELSSKLPRRRSSANRQSKSPDSLDNTWSKSTDSFDRLDESEEPCKPIPMRRTLNQQMSKSSDRVSKSSDSLENLENLNTVNSDDSIDRRRSSYELRNVQRSIRAMSKSSESFEVLEEGERRSENAEETQRSLARSAESLDKTEDVAQEKIEAKLSSSDLSKRCWRANKRSTVSSESSDNLELDDELENRRARRPSKRIASTSLVDAVLPANEETERKSAPIQTRKNSRFQKSSESSELGSTDTLDSDKKNKSSTSTETLDSLEKDIEQDSREEEEITDTVVEKRKKHDAWAGQVQQTDSNGLEMEETKALISDKSYWRQSSDVKENIDIHQLLAITIVQHIADNGNQRNSVIFPKKKLSSPPTSPEKQQDDNKIMFNNLLASKNDEDLQNMLNGNISEVSTDTKSFKEKLIMFEKLGK
ncbi:E3 ubiquitin-protein ligase BRE1-like isoform X2 [Diprion similis]|uniref:E3 ubiquitin-protein ligase BRE1-like isoform X2 n=1 Tax=Diprion similis TaxID=362088 RepID=UPI001EF89565|nr:E3 ubiquitin-protein ligase BRE1-like isoform X2 [Diprion similis]